MEQQHLVHKMRVEALRANSRENLGADYQASLTPWRIESLEDGGVSPGSGQLSASAGYQAHARVAEGAAARELDVKATMLAARQQAEHARGSMVRETRRQILATQTAKAAAAGRSVAAEAATMVRSDDMIMTMILSVVAVAACRSSQSWRIVRWLRRLAAVDVATVGTILQSPEDWAAADAMVRAEEQAV